jgi:hypothetical protein
MKLGGSLKFATASGLSGGLLTAVAMSFLDWLDNPSGLFRDDGGTRWNIVAETAMSWFWPVTLAIFGAAFVLHLLWRRGGPG